MLDNILGHGNVTRKDGTLHYKGTFPNINENGPTEVYVIRKGDLDTILETGLTLLLSNRKEMNPDNFKLYPDFLEITNKDGTPSRQFLDRHYYWVNNKDCTWIRYISVDEAFVEGELE